MKSLQRILAIVRKEVRQLRRDRLTFGMIVGIPVIQLLMFGYAINMDVRNLDAAVADMSGTSASRQMVMDMSQTQIIRVIKQVSSADELEHLMRQGKSAWGYTSHRILTGVCTSQTVLPCSCWLTARIPWSRVRQPNLHRSPTNPGPLPTMTVHRSWSFVRSTTRNGAHRSIPYRVLSV